MTGLDHAIIGLDQALDRPRRHQMWRWLVCQRINGVLDALTQQNARTADAWLSSREDALVRDGAALLRRLEDIAGVVVGCPDAEAVRAELKRLVADLERHRQRLNDLVYDTVSLELGGSE